MKLLTKDRYDEYEVFLKGCNKGHFMQAPMWADVKDNWKYEVILSEDGNGNIRGSMAVLIRKVPVFPSTIMYSPRGPVCDIYNKEIVDELIKGAKELAKIHKSYVLKIDPDVKASDEKFANIMKEIGFRNKNASANFEGIQPRFVFRLPIENRTEDEMFMFFHSKTRYNIRVAVKNGVETSIGTREDLPRFHEIMLETGLRDEFVIRSLGYFQKMYDSMGEHVRLYKATYNGEMISGTLAVEYGNKVWYLYGASSNAHRNVMPNYLLQWEMIKWSIELGCEIYDFRGVSGDISEENPLYGLYRFKKGFNGEFTEFIGEFDYVFNSAMYFAVEKGEKTFRKLRKKLFLLKNKRK